MIMRDPVDQNKQVGRIGSSIQRVKRWLKIDALQFQAEDDGILPHALANSVELLIRNEIDVSKFNPVYPGILQ